MIRTLPLICTALLAQQAAPSPAGSWGGTL